MIQPVSDIGSNAEENIAHAAKVIGRSIHRKRVFEAIYTGKRRTKTVSELIKTTGLPHRRVLDAGKKLADNRLVKAQRIAGQMTYEKIDFIHSNKKRILSLAASPEKLQALPTKRNAGGVRSVKIILSGSRARIKSITVDEIDSFRFVKKIDHSTSEIGDELSEAEFKAGLQRILNEAGRFKDWGGEVADLFTTHVKLKKRRFPTALALKGPAVKGKLTPGKMGKNGDQIQRLFEAPAEIYLVQYCRHIDHSVLAQMRQLAIARSLFSGTCVHYGIIDGKDSRRIVKAYPVAFRKIKRRNR